MGISYSNQALRTIMKVFATILAFDAVVAKQDNAAYTPLWTFCGGADGAITSYELVACGAKMANFCGMSEGSQNYVYNFGEKYWGVGDADGSGDFSFVEFKTAISAFAATN